MTSTRLNLIVSGISTLFLLAVYSVNFTLGQQLDNLDQIFQFPQLPAGIVFGIARGIIYLSLLVRIRTIWQHTSQEPGNVRRIHVFFRISAAANIGRITATAYEMYQLSFTALVVLFRALRLLFCEQHKFFTFFGQQNTATIPIGLYLGRTILATRLLSTSQAMHLVHGLDGSSHPLRLSIVFFITTLVVCVAWFRFRHRSVLALPIFGLGSLLVDNRFTNPHIAAFASASLSCLIIALLRTTFPRTQKSGSLAVFIILLLALLGSVLISKNRLLAFLYLNNPTSVLQTEKTPMP